MRILGTGTILVCVLLPQIASAAVVINEIAWMGTDENYRCEWIELFNDGSDAVDLEQWALQIGDGTIRSLADGDYSTLSIAGGGYLVVERLVNSCPDPVPASGDIQLAFGDIPNNYTSIALLRPDGSAEDTIGTNEELWVDIGGDNTTKETAQYSTGGWITGTPTPGAANSTAPAQEDENESDPDTAGSDTGQKDTSGGSSGSAEKEPPPQYELALSIDAPSRVYVNQPIELSAMPSGLSDALIDSVTYQWNFGDTHTTEGKEVNHAYAYAGTYVVTVYGSFARHEYVARHTVTVLPVTMSLAVSADGDIQVHNNARYEIDLSGYTIHGQTSFTFPDHTFLLPQATLTVPRDLLGGAPVASAILLDQEHAIVAHTGESTQEEVATSGIVAGARTQAVATPEPESDEFSFASDRTATGSEALPVGTAAPQRTEPATDTTDTVPVTAWPYLGLIGVVSAGMVTLFLRSNSGQG